MRNDGTYPNSLIQASGASGNGALLLPAVVAVAFGLLITSLNLVTISPSFSVFLSIAENKIWKK